MDWLDGDWWSNCNLAAVLEYIGLLIHRFTPNASIRCIIVVVKTERNFARQRSDVKQGTECSQESEGSTLKISFTECSSIENIAKIYFVFFGVVIKVLFTVSRCISVSGSIQLPPYMIPLYNNLYYLFYRIVYFIHSLLFSECTVVIFHSL